jgi:LEA14-like dessication related protein
VKKLFWLVPLAFVGWFFYTRSKFTFNFVGIKLRPKPAIIMQVYNPTSESSTINSIVADIYYKGTRLGIINMFKTVVISANTRTNLDLPLTADGFGFAVLVTDLVKTGSNVVKNAVVEVKGVINISGLPVSFTQTFNLS